MSRTKFIVALTLLIVFLVGCAQTTATRTAAPASALDRILQKKTLVVGTSGNMPPLNMINKQGRVFGYEADMAQMMADAMGVNVNFATMPFADLLPALEAGKIDIILSGMTITPERNLKVAFVGPYFQSGKAFLTKIERIANAKNPKEINNPNTTVVALKGSTSQYFVEQAIPKARLIRAKDYDEAVNLVLQDKVDAMVADYPICVISVFRYPNHGLVSVITPFTYEPIGIAMPRDPALMNWMQNFLSILDGTGRLDDLEARWFEDASWLKEMKD
jgi:polar amino acid transport system substrate-binding protein